MPRKNEYFYELLVAKIRDNLKTNYGQSGEFSYKEMGLEKTATLSMLLFKVWNKVEFIASSAEVQSIHGVSSSQNNYNVKTKQNYKMTNRDPVDFVIHCIFALERVKGSGYLTTHSINEKLRDLDSELNIKNLLKRIGAYVDTGYIEKVDIDKIPKKDQPNDVNNKTSYCFRIKKESFENILDQYNGKKEWTMSASYASPLIEVVDIFIDILKMFNKHQLNEMAKSMPDRISTFTKEEDNTSKQQLYFKFK